MASSPVTNNSPITESSVRATVSINGAAKSDEWEMASGGGKTAQTTKVRVGYSPNKTVTIPSVSDSGDVTITRNMVVATVWDLQAYLLSQVGIGTAAVWMTPMNRLGATDYAHANDTKSLVYVGLINSVTVVSASNESTAVATIVVGLTGGNWDQAV
jgi:hypothetical protein